MPQIHSDEVPQTWFLVISKIPVAIIARELVLDLSMLAEDGIREVTDAQIAINILTGAASKGYSLPLGVFFVPNGDFDLSREQAEALCHFWKQRAPLFYVVQENRRPNDEVQPLVVQITPGEGLPLRFWDLTHVVFSEAESHGAQS
jgi:hypothetical protein